MLDVGSHWMCFRCLRVARAFRGCRRFVLTRCTGPAPKVFQALIRPLGHYLALVHLEEWRPLAFCRRCGCYATAKFLGLGQPCHPTPHGCGRQNLRAIQRGHHPLGPSHGHVGTTPWDLTAQGPLAYESLGADIGRHGDLDLVQGRRIAPVARGGPFQ